MKNTFLPFLLVLIYVVGLEGWAFAQTESRPCPLTLNAEQCQRFQDRLRQYREPPKRQQPKPRQALPSLRPAPRSPTIEQELVLARIRRAGEARQQEQLLILVWVIVGGLSLFLLWPMLRRLAGGLKRVILGLGLSPRDIVWLIVVIPCVVWIVYSVWWKGVKLILWPLQKVWRALT